MMDRLKWCLASLTMRLCGCEIVYWTSPHEWEEYMSHGEPLPTITEVPDEIFKDIDAIIDSAPESDAADRVTAWLYSDKVRVEA